MARDTSPTVIGRSHEQTAMGDAVARLADGPVCLELVGEPGIGKTTMLVALGEIATAANARVVSGRGSEFEHDVEFGIFVDALDGLLGTRDDRWSVNLDADIRDELAEIFPALRAAGAGRRPPGLASERFRGYRAVRALLERLAATRPLVLALDDVHWADRSSTELIGALLRRPPAAPVLMALAYRRHQAPQRLQRELATASGEGTLERIDLGPLSRSDAVALLADGWSGRDRDRLFRESGGNPFYLHQLARAAGRGAADGDLGAGVPPAVAASLFAELEGVSPDARQLAQAAAVAGDPFDLDLAAQVAPLDRPVALACLDELVSADLVRAGDGPLGFVFRHPLVRRAVYESAQPGWRIGAHTRADAEMARLGVLPAARAHHVERSAEVGDQKAISVLVSAAGTAIVPGAAVHWLRGALRLAPADGEQRLGLLCRLGEALAGAGLLEESREALAEALAGWPVDAERDGRIGLIVMCASLDRLMGCHERGRALLSAATSELDDPNCASGVELAIELAAQCLFGDGFEVAQAPAAAARRSAALAGDPVQRAVAVSIAAFADYCACDLDSAEQNIAEAMSLVAELDDATLASRPEVFFFLGWCQRLLDHYEAGLDVFDRGVAAARASGRGQLYVELTAGRVGTLVAWGRLTDAQATSEEAIEAARLSENPQPLAWALLTSCMTLTDMGDLDGAGTRRSRGGRGRGRRVDGLLDMRLHARRGARRGRRLGGGARRVRRASRGRGDGAPLSAHAALGI